MSSYRLEKINQQLKRDIGMLLQRELGDPRVSFVSITAVNVSRDLRHAKVYFSLLGSAHKLKETQKALDSAKGFIRKMVGQRLRIRYNPELIFFYDDALTKSLRIEETLDEIRREHDEHHRNF